VAKPANILSGYLSEFEAAEQLKHNVQTLRGWRRRGKGPPCVVIGRRPYYRREALEAWLLKMEASAAA
jgi:hypothetical protein